MEAARFNAFWFMWLLAPMAIMFVSTRRKSRPRLVIGSLVSLAATYVLSILAVERKWSFRLSEAVTPQELTYATADGANMVFTLLFFAPAEALLFTLLWGLVGRRVWARLAPGDGHPSVPGQPVHAADPAPPSTADGSASTAALSRWPVVVNAVLAACWALAAAVSFGHADQKSIAGLVTLLFLVCAGAFVLGMQAHRKNRRHKWFIQVVGPVLTSLLLLGTVAAAVTAVLGLGGAFLLTRRSPTPRDSA